MSGWIAKREAPEKDWRNTPKGALADEKKKLLKCNTIEELNKIYDKNKSELTDFHKLMLDKIKANNMLRYLAGDIGSINILYPPGTGGNFLTIQLLGKDNQKNTVNEFNVLDQHKNNIRCYHPARFLYEVKPSVYKYWLNKFSTKKNILIHPGKYKQYVSAIAEIKGQYKQKKIVLSEDQLLKKIINEKRKGRKNPWTKLFFKQNQHMYFLSLQLRKYNKDCVFDLNYEKFFIDAEHDSIYDLSKFLNKDLSFIREKIIEYTKDNFNLLNPNKFI